MFAVIIGHFIGAGHDARRGAQRRTAGILKAIARLQDGLFADNSGAAHFLDAAVGIGNVPIAIEQLHFLLANIFKLNRIGPHVMLFLRIGLFLKIRRCDGDGNIVRGASVHTLLCKQPVVRRQS